MSHRYYPLLRPGVFPSGLTWVAGENWQPTRKIGEMDPTGQISHIPAHGWVEFAEQIPLDVALHFDLLPADELERAWYNVCRDHPSDAEWLANDYRQASEETLAQPWISEHERWLAKVFKANPDAKPLLSGRY